MVGMNPQLNEWKHAIILSTNTIIIVVIITIIITAVIYFA